MRELLHKRYTHSDQAPCFFALVNRFNLMAYWVGTEVFKIETPGERAEILAQFIKICAELRKMKNFNGVFALLAGLNHTAISRLKFTWEKVPRKQIRKYESLSQLLNTEKNNAKYRRLLAKTKPPLVPYLAIFSKDLFALEEATPTILENELINFDKMRMMWNMISSFKRFRQPYNIQFDNSLVSFLQNVSVISESEQYENSYRLEPKGASKQQVWAKSVTQ